MMRILMFLCLVVFGAVFSLEFVSAQNNTVQLINPIGGTADNPAGISKPTEDGGAEGPVIELIGRVVTSTLGLIGSLTLLVFMYGGFLWLTAGGSSDKIKKGWAAMFYAAIGLFIIFAAYAILSTVIKGLTTG